MDRLTYRDANGVAHIRPDIAITCAVQVLAEYEDSGFTPEQVAGVGKLPTRQLVADTMILLERHRQLAKWGDQSTRSWGDWCMILGEEYGELCEAMYETAIQTQHSKPERGGLDAIRREAVQVAAVAMAIVEATVRGKSHGTQD